eukprot:EG_transcript_19485
MPGKWYSHFTWDRLSAFMLSLDFWRLLEGDKVLLFQPDVWICPGAAARLSPFLQYDYVGAPWARSFHACPSRVGNGGLSLRDRRKALQVLEDPGTPAIIKKLRRWHGGAEDVIWCNLLALHRARVPSLEEAANFSVEMDDYGATAPVGVHDCTRKALLYRLEAGCPGVSARMTAIRHHKGRPKWAVEDWEYFALILRDGFRYCWACRQQALGIAAFPAVAYLFYRRFDG